MRDIASRELPVIILLRMSFLASRRGTCSLALIAFFLACSISSLPLALGALIQQLDNASGMSGGMEIGIILLTVAIAGTIILPSLLILATFSVLHHLDSLIDASIAEALSRPASADRLYTQSVRQDVVDARGGGEFGIWIGIWVLGRSIVNWLSLVALLGTIGLLAGLWYSVIVGSALILLNFSLAALIAPDAYKRQRGLDAIVEEQYLFRFGIDESQMEGRIFGYLQWLRRKYVDVASRAEASRRVESRSLLRGQVAAVLLAALAIAATLANLLFHDPSMDRDSGELVAILGSVVAAVSTLDPGGLRKLAQGGKSARAYLRLVNCELESDATVDGSTVDSEIFDDTSPSIEFKNVSYRYHESEFLALDNLSFVLEPGSRTGLVGLNGSGKSTLLGLIAGTLRPTSGTIFIGGVEMLGMSEDERMNWLQSIAMVPQSFIRIPGRIDDQLLIGFGGVEGCLEEVSTGDWVRQFERWKATLKISVEDQIPRLSGGEWQALVFYRFQAKLHTSRVRFAILDEPAAALDADSEERMLRQYFEQTLGISSIVVSHRLKVMKYLDDIIVLDGGRIRERGSHSQLLDQNGSYSRMYRAQEFIGREQ